MSSPPAAPELRELQRWLRWVLTDPRGVVPALADPRPQALAGDALKYPSRYSEPTRRHLGSVSGDATLDSAGRLGIYAEAYFARMAEALEGDYGAVRAVLGPESFLKLCADFLKAHPSACFNIGEVGEPLPGFLAHDERAAQNPWLPELAKLEWNVVESFYATDRPGPGLDVAALGAIPPQAWEGMCFELDGSVRLLTPFFEIEKLWQERGEEEALARALEALAESAAGSGLLIFRDRPGRVHVERLSRAQHGVLARMQEGACLGELCEKLELGEDGELPPLLRWFSSWVSQGVIASIRKANSC